MVFGSKKKKPPKNKDSEEKKAEAKKPEQKESVAPDKASDPVEIGEPNAEIAAAPDSAQPPEASNPKAQQAGSGTQIAATTVPGPPPEEIYVDGVSSLFFRSGVVKLECYRVVRYDNKENKEVRMGTHRLILPVKSLQELVQLLQNASNLQRSQAENVKSDEVG